MFKIDSNNKYYKKLPDFRIKVSDVLCLFENITPKNAVGRPHSQNPQIHKVKRSYNPLNDIRFDGVGHIPDILDCSDKKVCKMQGCKSET